MEYVEKLPLKDKCLVVAARLGAGAWLCGRCHPNLNKEATVLARTKAHTQYKLKDGTTVPGVTTVLSILNEPALVEWARECGCEGLDYREVRDSAGIIGTLAHYLIACHLKGVTPDTSEYSPAEVETARHCLAKYQLWEKEHSVSPVAIETPLVSEEFRYGGTPDLLAELDGELVLIDFKTGSGGIYREIFYRLAAYWRLLAEQGWPLADARILRVTADDDDFEVVIKTNLGPEWQVFTYCLAIYRLQGGVMMKRR